MAWIQLTWILLFVLLDWTNIIYSQLQYYVRWSRNLVFRCQNILLQVTDVKKGEQPYTVPALGLAWANLVNCRLQMFRQHNTRQLHVIFAPHLPLQSCQFNITSNGVVGLDWLVLVIINGFSLLIKNYYVNSNYKKYVHNWINYSPSILIL